MLKLSISAVFENFSPCSSLSRSQFNMLRFEGGKAHAEVLERMIATFRSQPVSTKGHSTLGEKRSPGDEQNHETKRIKLESTNGVSTPANGKMERVILKFEIDFDLISSIDDSAEVQHIPIVPESYDFQFASRNSLQYRWASMSVNWQQQLLLEHEIAVPRKSMGHKGPEAFWALANGCKQGYIALTISSMRATNSATISVKMQAEIQPACPLTFLFSLLQYAFQPPPAPLHYTIEQFYQHLQPLVSHDVATAYISPELCPRLLPFQSQNVQWMVSCREAFELKILLN